MNQDCLREAGKYVTSNIDYTEYITSLLLDKADAYLEFYRWKKWPSDTWKGDQQL